MFIDGHTHIFSQDFARYPLADPQNSYRPSADGTAEALRRAMDQTGVDRAFTITPAFNGWDNSYALDALADHGHWLAVGVLVDPRHPDAPHALTRLVDRGACGLRFQGRIQQQHPLDDDASTPLWTRAADLDLTVDVNATHDEYPQVSRRAEAFPNLRLVLDHCGYIAPDLAPTDQAIEPVLAMARHPNLFAKISFVPLASGQAYPFADTFSLVRRIVDAFGAERCLYGSNFPTAQYNPQMTYGQTASYFEQNNLLSAKERQWILGKTAAKLWRWSA